MVNALTSPVSSAATTNVPKACHQCPPTNSQDRAIACVPPATLNHERLDSLRQPDADIDARDDVQGQLGHGRQPDQRNITTPASAASARVESEAFRRRSSE